LEQETTQKPIKKKKKKKKKEKNRTKKIPDQPGK